MYLCAKEHRLSVASVIPTRGEHYCNFSNNRPAIHVVSPEKEYSLFSDLSFDRLDLPTDWHQYQTPCNYLTGRRKKKRRTPFCWQSTFVEWKRTVADGFTHTCMGRVMMPRLAGKGVAGTNEIITKEATSNRMKCCFIFVFCSFKKQHLKEAECPPRPCLWRSPCKFSSKALAQHT